MEDVPRILELCAGYGGLGVAVAALTGGKVTHVAEVDPVACAILAERFPGVPNIGDITSYDWSRLCGEVDIITAGFPCQGLSNAGLRKGLHDERSALWFNVRDAIGSIRPRYVFLENVAALRTRGLGTVAEGLAEIGYDLRWTTVRASDVEMAHHRARWFGIAVPHAQGV